MTVSVWFEGSRQPALPQNVCERHPHAESAAEDIVSEIEAVVEHFVRGRLRDPQGDIRLLVAAHIRKITVHGASLEVELANQDSGEPGTDAGFRQIVTLPWSKKPFRAAKGVTSPSSTAAKADPKANATVLAAIAKARRWVDALIDGTCLAELANREGKGERQIRQLLNLAFLPPQQMRSLMSGDHNVGTKGARRLRPDHSKLGHRQQGGGGQ
jgi:hypothetical protein